MAAAKAAATKGASPLGRQGDQGDGGDEDGDAAEQELEPAGALARVEGDDAGAARSSACGRAARPSATAEARSS